MARPPIKPSTATRFTSSGWFVALLLIAFSGSGLMAGVMARQVGSFSLGGSPQAPALASQTTATTPSTTGKFDLRVQLTPNPVRAGQSVQLVVTAYTATSAPVADVRCTPLQTATAPSFTVWPGAVATDATGQARWSLQLADQTPPGSYQVYVQGESASYHGRWFGTLVVAS